MDKKTAAGKNRNVVFACVFCLLFFCGVVGSLVLAVVTRGKSFEMTLFHPNDSLNQDFFMDFFNSIRDASTMDVYEKGIIYPPLANLLFFFFSKFMPIEITSTSFYGRYDTQTNQRMIMVYLIFALLCVVMFALMSKYYLKKNRVSNGLAEVLSFIFILFYPTVYCIERGNIILLSMICTAFFVFFHDSREKMVREASLLLLAVAAALKIYPAVFGLLLLVERRYRSALKAVGYGLVLFFVPFLFYEHGASLFQFIQNLITFSSDNKASYSTDSVSILNLFYYLSDKYVSLGQIVFIAAELISIAALFFVPKKWHRYMLLSIILLNVQSVSSSYSMVFMIIPLIAFFADKQKKGIRDVIYLILFSLLLIPIPCFYIDHPEWVQGLFNAFHLNVSYNINRVLALPVVQIFFLFMCAEAIAHAVEVKRSGKPLISCIIGEPKKKTVPAKEGESAS